MNHLNLEALGVTLATPTDAPITVDAESWTGLILHLYLHRSNLVQANAVLRLENPSGASERIAEVQASLIGMATALDSTLAELLRIGHAQGLQLHSIADAPKH
jgi:hypothetical protein